MFAIFEMIENDITMGERFQIRSHDFRPFFDVLLNITTVTFCDGMRQFAIHLNTVTVRTNAIWQCFGGIIKIGLETSKI